MSIRTQLIAAFSALILLALLLAGGAVIALRLENERQAALDRLAVAAPQITLDLFRLQRQNASPETVLDYVREQARAQDVRALIVDRAGTVTIDTGDTLRGKQLAIPEADPAGPAGYRMWEGSGEGQDGLIFLAAAVGPGLGERRGGPRIQLPLLTETVVLAVPQQTVTNAWRGLLPGLMSAGLIALTLSAVVAALFARSIARPLQALTRASEEMARGNFDHDLQVRRSDEIGRLASAFNRMAREVGKSHLQMRGLLANVTHDLKTPLTSVIGFAQALRDGDVDEPAAVRDTGAIIHDEAQRIRLLVDDLLYLSEIESGQAVFTKEPVELPALTTRAMRRAGPALAERNIRLEQALPVALTVQGDGRKLERILDNLLDNAAKYTPEGGRVEVRARREPGTGVIIEVFNTGSYIAPEDLERVFDRFARLDRARGRAGGSGLGLAIARELAELHGGTLTATSDAAGTTFTLTLTEPKAVAATATTPAGTAPRPAAL